MIIVAGAIVFAKAKIGASPKPQSIYRTKIVLLCYDSYAEQAEVPMTAN